jgi:hypothetical protein
VGGSYPESESQLSKIALQWMICEAEFVGLRVEQNRKADILGGKPPYVVPDPVTKNQHESLRGLWWIRRAMAEGSSGGELSGSMVEASARESWASPLDCAKFPRPYIGGAEAGR